MSYNDYLKAIELIDKNKHLIGNIYPQSDQSIKNAERFLNIHLPESYRDFLKRYGTLSIGAKDVFGLDDKEGYDAYRYENIVCNTLDERKVNYQTPFPEAFVPIYNLGDGEKFCLDTSKINDDGECPLMGWYAGNIDSLESDVGEDFGDFLLNFIMHPALDSIEKRGAKVER